MRMQRFCGALTLCLLAPATPLIASDAPAMFCEGPMVFPNTDGSSVTYMMRLAFRGDGYSITSTDTATNETFTDTGTCDTYLDGTCRYVIEDGSTPAPDFYDFGLKRLSGDSFAYQEVWKDRAVGRTILTCRNEIE